MKLDLTDYQSYVDNLSKNKKACIIFDKISSLRDSFLEDNPHFFNNLEIEIQTQYPSVEVIGEDYDYDDLIAGNLNAWSSYEIPALQCAHDITYFLQDEMDRKGVSNSSENKIEQDEIANQIKIKGASFKLDLSAITVLRGVFIQVNKLIQLYKGNDLEKLMKILGSSDYSTLSKTDSFQFHCQTKEFVYLIHKLETTFSARPTYSTLERKKLFITSNNYILTADNMSKTKLELELSRKKIYDLIDKIFESVRIISKV